MNTNEAYRASGGVTRDFDMVEGLNLKVRLLIHIGNIEKRPIVDRGTSHRFSPILPGRDMILPHSSSSCACVPQGGNPPQGRCRVIPGAWLARTALLI